MKTFIDIIRRWPSVKDFAADIGIRPGNASAWNQRNSIPSKWWGNVVVAAEKRGFSEITFLLLAQIASRKTKRGSAKCAVFPKKEHPSEGVNLSTERAEQ